MTERINRLSGGLSGPDRKAERFQLDFVTWRDHLAAPGSRFAPEGRGQAPAIRLDVASSRVDAGEPDRCAA